MPVRAAHGNGERIRERSSDKDAVKQARERVADTFARNGSARATRGERIDRNAERFDEVLLTHHRRFAGHGCVATGARVLQRIDEYPPTFAEAREIRASQDIGALCRALDVPAAWATGAMLSEQALVPRLGRRERRRRRLGSWIMKDRVLIDPAVHGAGLDAHDEGNRQTRKRGLNWDFPGELRRAPRRIQ